VRLACTIDSFLQNLIKRQAREHEGFKQTCISFAQALHRVDMRLRLGLLRDTATIEKQAAREAADAAAKKHRHSIPTVKTEAQTLADEKAAKEKARSPEAPKSTSKPRIRPLSEAKAIESGATFISEAFLFGVAGSLIVFESWRSRRKENTRREDVADRLGDLEESEKAARRALVELEREVLALRAKHEKNTNKNVKRILPKEVWVQEEKEETEDAAESQGWLSRISSYILSKKDGAGEGNAANEPGPAEKILSASDAALAARHQHALEEAAKVSAKNSTEKKPP
jgi:optic atrophy 3 protein